MIGTLLNERYRLDQELGKGGMGAVFSGYDLLLDREVAIKVVNQAGQSSLSTEGKARLLHEAQAAAKLNHPNIVSIYDAGEADGVPFIVMELIHGESLYELPPLPIRQVISVARQICAALEHAHSHGIIHRDLKPENVILTLDGRVKLTDFGLARTLTSRISVEGPIVGTVLYLAPEAALRKTVDGRADLYSLGVMLYEMTTGQLPFSADDPLAVISQHLYAPVVPPRAIQPDIPSALDTLIVQLMNKLPEDRPNSAGDVRRILEIMDNLSRIESQLETPPPQVSMLDRLVRGRLIGREQEMEEMINAWRRAISNEGSVLLITGEPGIGKTRVANELVARVSVSGGKALTGECYSEGDMPYGPFNQMLQETLLAPNANLHLPDYVLSGLITLAPSLRSRYTGISQVPALDPQVEQQHIFESMVAWCTALAEQTPVLLLVDDVHWADSGTLALLRYLARRSRKLRLLIALTYREIELAESTPLQSLLNDFQHERLSTRVKLIRFNKEQTREMLTTMLTPSGAIDSNLVDAIYRETEGNPFFIEEVTKALIEVGKLCYNDICWQAQETVDIEIPQSVRITVQSRLARLPAETQEVLRVAAILGREFDFDTLSQATGVDEEQLIDALETAEQAQIIAEVPHRRVNSMTFTFAHALFPTTLRESISMLRRQRLHRRVAAAIESLHPEDGYRLETLAYHYEQAGDAEKALFYYVRAADRALSVYANQEAERYYRSALELSQDQTEKSKLLAGLGEALFRQSHYTEAGEIWLEAIQLFKSTGDYDQVARLYARSARTAWYAGDPPRGLALSREGLAYIQGLADQKETPGMATLLHEVARAYHFNNLSDEAMPLCQQALAMAKNFNLIDLQADTLATIGILPNQPPEQARQALEQAVELAESAGYLAIAARAHLNLGEHLENHGQIRKGRAHYLQARDLAHRMGMVQQEHDFYGNAVDVSIGLGEYSFVEEALPQLTQQLTALVNPAPSALHIHEIQARLSYCKGEVDEAMHMIKICQEEAHQKDLIRFLTGIQCDVADIYIDMHRLDQADGALEDALQNGKFALLTENLMMRILLSSLRSHQGRKEEARQLLEETRKELDAQLNASLSLKGQWKWAEARLAAAEKNWGLASDSYEQLNQLAEQSGSRWYQIRILAEWAEVCILSGRPEDQEKAQTLSDQAMAITRQLKIPRYGELIQKRLESTRETVK